MGEQPDLRDVFRILVEIRDLLKPKEKKPRGQSIELFKKDTPRLVDLWNKYTDKVFPKVESISPASTRFKQAIERWKEHPDEKFWWAAIMKMNKSSFHRGQNDRKWVASFEFFVKPDAAAKILEGKCDDSEWPKKEKLLYFSDVDPRTGEITLRTEISVDKPENPI